MATLPPKNPRIRGRIGCVVARTSIHYNGSSLPALPRPTAMTEIRESSAGFAVAVRDASFRVRGSAEVAA